MHRSVVIRMACAGYAPAPMRRTALPAVVLALALALAAPAPAAVTLGGAPGGLRALTVAGGAAYAVVGSGEPAAPLELVRSAGAGRSTLQRFGEPGADFPDLATGLDDAIVVSWAQPVSNGERYMVARSPGAERGALGAPQTLATGTGPGRLALGLSGEPMIAFPDVDGDAALADGVAAEARLTASAPERRHLPLDMVVDGAGRAFVLDLVQTGDSSQLVLLGPDAPTAPAVSVPALRGLPATLAIDGGRAYVAYLLDGHAHLASAPLEPGGRWGSRRLPGRGGGAGAPALVRTGARTLVAYTQRQRHGRGDVFLATEGPRRLRVRRLTRTRADERLPFAAASPAGDVFVGWSRAATLHGRSKAVVARVS
jgi:hypothetical protein